MSSVNSPRVIFPGILKLVFASDDMNEIFYNKYGYFPDEISNEYYDRITGDIPYLYTNFIPEIGSEILYSY